MCHGINGSAYLRLCQYPAAVSSLEQATTHPMDPADAAEQLANLGMAYSGVEAYGKALAVHSKVSPTPLLSSQSAVLLIRRHPNFHSCHTRSVYLVGTSASPRPRQCAHTHLLALNVRQYLPPASPGRAVTLVYSRLHAQIHTHVRTPYTSSIRRVLIRGGSATMFHQMPFRASYG